jgi:hypothetical protein
MKNPAESAEQLEEWRLVADAPNYEISSHGRLRRITNGRGTRAGRMGGHVNSQGYLCFTFIVDGKRKTRSLHRLVAHAFLGPPPTPKHTVAHSDGDRLNPRLSNLRWATYKENESDKIRHGTYLIGRMPKMKQADIEKLRELYAQGISGTKLARQCGLNPTTVYNYLRR